ncbi:MAG: hypothetical protein ABSC95_21040 [Acetobacteraceae bacterium]|jgi:hypothetical protein
MRSSLAAGLACLLGLALPGTQAHALQFDQMTVSPTEVIVGGRGPIVKGDTDRLQRALAAVPPTQRLLGLALDSPGGNVVEGEQLAKLIRARGLPVVIPSNSKCVSACFLLLAASPRRLAASDALVGVHSASEEGEETDTALAVTTLMARVAAELGIPPAIIGKMVQTKAASVEWLTRADLVSMDVTIFDNDTPSATRQAGTSIGTQIAPGPVPAAPQPGPPPVPLPQQAINQPPPVIAPQPPAAAPTGFASGRDDRRAWNSWLAGLHGPYRDGAVFALSQFGMAMAASCYGPQGVSRGDFTSGCEAAHQRLAAVEVRLRGNPDYAAGWNGTGIGTTTAASQPIRPTEPTEAEYDGAYFCGRQVAHLLLTVFPAGDGSRRRAMFSFGPGPTSPNVPRGAFIVEGAIDLHGGEMALSPVKWVSQPGTYNWLGLSGHSTDGGRTFAGRIIDSTNQCTIFTLQRVGDRAPGR